MKRLILFLGLLFLTGCSIFQPTADNNVAPQLLIEYPLPIVTRAIARPNLQIEMDLLILEDGSVGKVNLISGSGDKVWDSLAVQTVLKWKYSSAHVDHHNVKIWLHQVALVEYRDPQYVFLAEILCPTLEEADSVYTDLENGKDFDELADLHAALPDHEKNGDIGKVDIRLYPEHIRTQLAYLGKDKYTKPLKYGDKYIIFKRK